MNEIAEGKIKRVIAFRLEPGEDVLNGLESVCKDKGIKDGIILSALGSLDGASFYNPTLLPNNKIGYGKPIKLDGYIELVNASGMICHSDEGELLLHVHVTLTDGDGIAHGGHLTSGNKVLLTTDMVIAEFEGLSMGRRFDKELEVFLFDPKQA